MDFDDGMLEASADAPASNCDDEVPDSEDKQQAPQKRRRVTRGGFGDRSAAKTCFAGSCSVECVKGKKWCPNHNRMFDAMSYHARKDKKELEAFNRIMANALDAEQAFNRFSEDNPVDGKWARKRFIEWTQFKKEHSLAIVQGDRKGTKPFEKNQWLQRGMHKMGWSKQQCLTEWEKHAKDSTVHRDSLGLEGSLRLWIRVVEVKTEDVERTGFGGGRRDCSPVDSPLSNCRR